MEKRQNLDFLKAQYRAFSKLGLDLGSVCAKDFLKQPWKLICNAIINFYIQYGLLRYSVNVFHESIHKATTTLIVFNQSLLIVVKIAVVLIKSNKVLKLIWNMNLLATKANARERELWVAQNTRGMIMSKIYINSCWVCLITSAVFPLSNMSYQYWRGVKVELRLPYGGQFPFQDHGPHIFFFYYFLWLCNVYILVHLTVALDSFFCWTVHAISGHFRILRRKITDAANKIEMHDNHKDLQKDIGCIVEYHIQILEFLDAVNNIFGFFVLFEVMLSCFEVCFLIYSLNNDTDINTLSVNGMAFVAVAIQIIIYCYGGEKVKNENDLLCYDIYDKFPWEKMSPSERKLLLLPLMRSQKVASVSGIFFELNCNLLVYIYKTAFSFNTLLGTMRANDNSYNKN